MNFIIGPAACLCLVTRSFGSSTFQGGEESNMSEADTCRTYVIPKQYAAGWTDEQIREQVAFTAGRIIPIENGHTCKEGKPADYLLRYCLDFPIAVVEAKPEDKNPGDG